MIRISAIALLVSLPPATVPAQEPTPTYGAAAPVFADWCFGCHSGIDAEAGLDLETLPGRVSLLQFTATVLKLRDRVRVGEMPPPDFGAIDEGERQVLLAWARDAVRAAAATLPPEPGRVTVRRLSRVEYDNTLRDLFGVGTALSAGFPADDLGYGFDNIGDALSFSGLHLEKYLAAAEDVARQVIDTEDPDHPTVRRFEAELMGGDERGVSRSGEIANLYSRAQLEQRVELPRAGEYVLRFLAFGDQAGDEPARMALSVNGGDVRRIDVPETRTNAAPKELRMELPAGRVRVELAFINDYYQPQHKDPKRRDRNLKIDWLEVMGPVDRREPPAGSEWLLEGDRRQRQSAARARPILRRLVERAWRRPARDPELRRLGRLVAAAVDAGESFRQALRGAVQAVLVSPHFLFRIESGGHRGSKGAAVELTGYQLASRLSYFLWSSTPDQRLLEVAGKGGLHDIEVLVAETQRMLRDPKAEALASHFAAQWLELRNLADVTPDPERFPGFDSELRAAMRRETELLFLHVLRNGRPIAELLDADYTFVNGRLAHFYGIAGVTGAEFRRVTLPKELRARGGVLGHASVLTVTSDPTRTSPVKRGKWVLENLLDAPPPPPPPGNAFSGDQVIDSAASLREQLERHRADPKCAICHVRMDELGYALERYDAIGRFRASDGGGPIDATGKLPDGTRLDGLGDLKRYLRSDPGFLRALMRKLFVFGVGRDTEVADRIRLEAVAGSLPLEQTTLEDLVLAIVRLDAFRLRRIVE